MVNDKHKSEFYASGLSNEMIDRAGFRSIVEHEACKFIGNPPSYMRWGPGWVVPYLFPNEDVPTYWRFKPDFPRAADEDGKVIKYESARGSQNRLYIPPGFFELSEGKGKIIITEGEKKALKAVQDGFACIGLSGVWNWQQKRMKDDHGKKFGERRLIRDFDLIPLKGRTVVITFDSDIEQNESVMLAMARLAEVLARDYKCNVLDGRIPYQDRKKCGLDDYLVQHGKQAFQKIVDFATEVERPSKMRAIDWAKRYVIEKEIFKTDHTECRTLHFWRDEMWRWNQRCWEKMDNSELRCRVHLWLDEQGAPATPRQAREVAESLQSVCLLSSSVEPNEFTDPARRFLYKNREFLSCKNGVVHLPDVGVDGAAPLHDPTPEFFSFNCLDYDWTPRPMPPVRWMRFLRELWPDDQESIDALQEWFGYCLLPSTQLQKIMLIVGPKRSGKGTIARILRKLVGEHNCVSPTLDSLTRQFGMQSLLDHSVATISDARLSYHADKSLVVERLLTISGEDAVTIDRKNLPAITTQLTTRFTILTNDLPQLHDVSGAFTSRLIILRMDRSFLGNEDVDLTGKLEQERQGILDWAIEGWRRVRTNRRILEPASTVRIRETMADLVSPVSQFVSEFCEVGTGPEFTIRCDDLYEIWKAWCSAQGVKWTGSNIQLGRDLTALVPALDRVRTSRAGRRDYCYQGIRLVATEV